MSFLIAARIRVKGTGLPDGLSCGWHVLTGFGLSVAGGFRIFVRAPDIFYWDKLISSGKCEHRLAFNVRDLSLSVPTNQRLSIF